jgi:uncharacterized Ntn-hydrolase superfamily protein
MADDKLAATYSIIAIDKKNGEMGVAVQSHYFSVGSAVPWAKSGVGVVATQSFLEVSYGPLGLSLMEGGVSSKDALKALIKADPRPKVRQVAMLDVRGNLFAHTGRDCIPEAGHRVGDSFSVQANLMRNRKVWPAMADAYSRSRGGLAYRLMGALEAGEGAGGDIRGRQSAAILIVRTKPSGVPWKDKIMELRVEDNGEPLRELRRLIGIHDAYRHADLGDSLAAEQRLGPALREYESAARIAPDIEELKFWEAVTLLSNHKPRLARHLLKQVFAANDDWKQVLRNIPRTRLYPIDKRTLVEALKA